MQRISKQLIACDTNECAAQVPTKQRSWLRCWGLGQSKKKNG